MNYKNKTTAVYTILHLLVDFSTIFLVSKVILGPLCTIANRGNVIIAYNLIAFAGQLPIGILSDVIGKNRFLTALSCALICISYLLSPLFGWTSLVFAALGNAIFHVGAGSDILEMSMPKAGLSGLFVSSGAIGVYLAYKAEGTLISVLCPSVMLLACIFLLMTRTFFTPEKKEFKIHYKKPGLLIASAVICFMLTVVIRSFLGMIMNFSWKAMPLLSALFILAVAAGKAAGGFICDRFGYIKTAAISLSLSFILFCFSFSVPVAGIVAVLCFNMTMPLTLTAIAGVSNQKYGFAFGMTTFALAIGFIPTVFGAGKLFSVPSLLWSVLLSLILFILGCTLVTKAKKGER